MLILNTVLWKAIHCTRIQNFAKRSYNLLQKANITLEYHKLPQDAVNCSKTLQTVAGCYGLQYEAMKYLRMLLTTAGCDGKEQDVIHTLDSSCNTGCYDTKMDVKKKKKKEQR